jgi:hypothetical protein
MLSARVNFVPHTNTYLLAPATPIFAEKADRHCNLRPLAHHHTSPLTRLATLFVARLAIEGHVLVAPVSRTLPIL